MSDDDDESNVVPLVQPKDKPSIPVKRKRIDYEKCHHRGTLLIDERARTAECETCGVVLDPVWALVELANHYDFSDTLRELKRARAELGTITAQVKRMRAVRSREKTAGYVAAKYVAGVLDQALANMAGKTITDKHDPRMVLAYCSQLVGRAKELIVAGGDVE